MSYGSLYQSFQRVNGVLGESCGFQKFVMQSMNIFHQVGVVEQHMSPVEPGIKDKHIATDV